MEKLLTQLFSNTSLMRGSFNSVGMLLVVGGFYLAATTDTTLKFLVGVFIVLIGFVLPFIREQLKKQ